MMFFVDSQRVMRVRKEVWLLFLCFWWES